MQSPEQTPQPSQPPPTGQQLDRVLRPPPPLLDPRQPQPSPNHLHPPPNRRPRPPDSSLTTSLPSTPATLKPLVQKLRRALSRASCSMGKLKQKPTTGTAW
jgi:hypothetical protein